VSPETEAGCEVNLSYMEVKKVHTGNRGAIRHHTGVPLPAVMGYQKSMKKYWQRPQLLQSAGDGSDVKRSS
jgi:hypothetical protein